MKYYMAPLEGITGYVYRNAYHRCFTDFDKYFLPFIAPHEKRSYNAREKRDLALENNEGMYAVPQVLTNQAAAFLRILSDLESMGYHEVNLNLGCPSGTVVSKGRGSGFLDHPEKLREFFEEVFQKLDLQKMKVSVKTRVGFESTEVWEEILDIYESFPLEEVIIHPRIRTDFYQHPLRMECFELAEKYEKITLCYNGELNTAEDVEQLLQQHPDIDRTMYGRGVIRNPGLLQEIKGEENTSLNQIMEFHELLYEGYCKEMDGEKNVLFKMKEVWSYMGELFPEGEKLLKKIRKANRTTEYQSVVRELFRTLN